jgi:putative phosphoribosyl transferase
MAVANELGILMDVMVVRKVQIPWNTEAGFGAVTMDGETVLNEPLVAQLCLTREVVEESILKTKRIVQERLRKFRGDQTHSRLEEQDRYPRGRRVSFRLHYAGGGKIRDKKSIRKVIAAIPTGSSALERSWQPRAKLQPRTTPDF